jgi:hypothetical protein
VNSEKTTKEEFLVVRQLVLEDRVISGHLKSDQVFLHRFL